MFQPKVSIILLTYNQEDTIARALDSVLHQRCCFTYEIILSDDASSDSTRCVCERYAEAWPDRIRLMPYTPNKGIVDNYFDCLLEARGEYIADCAGDDEWADENRLQQQVEYLDCHSEEVAVMSDWIIVGGNVKERIFTSRLPKFACFQCTLSGEEMLRQTLSASSNFPLLSAMLFRRRAAMNVYNREARQLRRTEWGCEDLPIICALASQGSFGYLPLNASVYNITPGSATQGRNAERLMDFSLRALKCRLDLCDIYGVEYKDVKAVLIPSLRYLAGLAFKIRKPRVTRQVKAIARRAAQPLPLVSRVKLLLS